MSKSKIDSLTSLRFFAAAAIVVYHSSGHFGIPVDNLKPFILDQGVSFFFVLSGFILTMVYGEKLKTLSPERSKAVGSFIAARIARIWPLHLATLLIFALLLPEHFWDSFTPSHFLASFFLVQSWIPFNDFNFAFNGVSWSLSAELFFYLAFPLLVINYERNWLRNLTLAFLPIPALAFLANYYQLSFQPQGAVGYHALLYVSPFTRVFEFALGMAAFAWAGKVSSRLAKSSLFIASVLEFAALALVIFITYKSEKLAIFFTRLSHLGEPAHTWLSHGGTVALSFALLILVFSFSRGIFSRLLSLPALVYLGEISFSVYLVHRLLLHYYYDHFATIGGAGALALYWAVLLASSHLLFELVECPARAFITTWYKTRNWRDALPKKILTNKFHLSLALVEGAFLLALPAFLFSGPALLPVHSVTGDNKSSLSKVIAHYGEDVDLVCMDIVPAAQGTVSDTVNLRLVWRARRPQKLEGFVGLHLYTKDGVYYQRRDYKRAYREDKVASGALWQDLVPLSRQELATTSEARVSIWGIGPQLATLDVVPQTNEINDGITAIGQSQIAVTLAKPANQALEGNRKVGTSTTNLGL